MSWFRWHREGADPYAPGGGGSNELDGAREECVRHSARVGGVWHVSDERGASVLTIASGKVTWGDPETRDEEIKQAEARAYDRGVSDTCARMAAAVAEIRGKK